ncbi:hypothetical protein KY366_02140 [Candidatus Woesearchaeota archaeon]|nr:hypothetical protein [Candidatus Woesearchaeota archaeon]
MEESLEDAKEEIKRVDHLFYVSLKYTRTVDMMRSMIGRLISTFDYGMLSLLKYSKEKKKTNEIPETPISKCELLKEIYEETNIKKYMDLYLLLRKLMKSPYTKKEEYRRHVTMISQIGDKKVDTNIDILKEYYEKTTKFVSFVQQIIREG